MSSISYSSTSYSYEPQKVLLPNPTLWYDFSQGYGNDNFSNTIKDISGNGHDGTSYNMSAANNYNPHEYRNGRIHINNSNNQGGKYIDAPSSFFSSTDVSSRVDGPITVCIGLSGQGHMNYYAGYENIFCGSYNSSTGAHWGVGYNSSAKTRLMVGNGSQSFEISVGGSSSYATVLAFHISKSSNYVVRYSYGMIVNNAIQIESGYYVDGYFSKISWADFNNFSIGRWPSLNYRYSNVKIGHVMLWKNFRVPRWLMKQMVSNYLTKYLK